MGVKTLVHIALLKMLIRSIRYGHVEGIRVMIEKGVDLQYVDKKGRNLLQLAIKEDTSTKMQMYVILADAGCNINHIDARGWSVVHYACASGADDVLMDLIRRGAHFLYNCYGFCGEMDLLFPRIVKAQSLLQHTEQLSHNQQVKTCWSIFYKQLEALGYSLQTTTPTHPWKSPLKISFTAPEDHSSMDRIRIVDIHAHTPIWRQTSKTFTVPPGSIGSITLDTETLDRPSVYHIYYEQHHHTPMELPPEALRALENTFCVKDLDSGLTVSVKAANDIILRELESTKARLHIIDEVGSNQDDIDDVESAGSCSSSTQEPEWDDQQAFVSDTYSCVAMLTVSIHIPRVPPVTKSTELSSIVYEITISYTGHIGLTFEGLPESKTHKVKIVVTRTTDAFMQLFPQVEVGDMLVAMNGTNMEYAGLKHTIWELKEARRPLVLHFRRQECKSSGFSRLLRRKSTVMVV